MKTIVLDSYIKENISSSNYYRRTRLVARSACLIRLVTHSTHLAARSARLSTRSPGFSTLLLILVF